MFIAARLNRPVVNDAARRSEQLTVETRTGCKSYAVYTARIPASFRPAAPTNYGTSSIEASRNILLSDCRGCRLDDRFN